MADYPCDAHRARYAGDSCRIYLNVYRKEEKIQMKGSICSDCLATLLEDWLSWPLFQSTEGWMIADPDEPAPLESRWMPSGDAIQALNGSTRFRGQ